MSWIGIECGIAPHELEKWGCHLERMGGGSGVEVGEFLRRCGRVLAGGGVSQLGMDDRLREIELRAVESIERKRNDVMDKATRIISSIADEQNMQTTVSRVMAAAGMDGWRAGRESGPTSGNGAGGLGNGGVRRSRLRSKSRKRNYKGGVVRNRGDGSLVSSVERMYESTEERLLKSGGGDGVSGRLIPARGGNQAIRDSLTADERYAKTYAGWCGSQLRAQGYKMKHIARALRLDVSGAWRHISAYERYWKRMAVGGVNQPPISDKWKQGLEDAILVAEGKSDSITGEPIKSRPPVVKNGSKNGSKNGRKEGDI